MKVDEFSGVGTYLLDPDGHRRFGRFATGNFIHGFGAVQRGSDWIFRAQQACQQVWSSPNSLTFLSDGRLHYEFREDRIVVKYLNPSRADVEQTVWLGNFGRHTFISHALAGGRTLAEVRDAAGHANVSITSGYLHVAVDDESGIGSLFG